MKKKRTTTAGLLVKELLYTSAASRESAGVRREKRKLSTEAQKRMNAKHSWQKLEEMLAANFVPGDLIVTLTYDDDHLPKDREEAQRRLKKFRRLMTQARRARDCEAVMIWNSETASGEGRWHHHLVMNATGGDDFEEIRAAWPYGQNVEIRTLELSKEKNYESQARYMCKEARERPGLRTWSYTRNCRHPETESFNVSDDTELQLPEDCIIAEEQTVRNEYGSWHYVKYIRRSAVQKTRRKRTRRR